jgi:hypothetical protein
MMRTLKVVGFTSEQSAHAHLLKHVLRVTEADERDDEADRDTERWNEILPDPPLETSLERRRQGALTVLSRSPGCAVGSGGVTAKKPCATCQDLRAMSVITREMTDLLTAYVSAASVAINGAFANPDRHGPRLVASRDGRVTRVETVDSRHIRVVGLLDASGDVRLVTCFRDRSRSLRSYWLELARVRAAHRRAGTLESLEPDDA